MARPLAETSHPRDLALAAVVASLAVTAVYGLAYARPLTFVSLVTEDSGLEHATFVGWLLAAVAWILPAHPLPAAVAAGHAGRRRPLAAAVCLFLAFEEINWGERLLRLTPPRFFAERNLQGQLSVHNFLVLPDYYPLVGLLLLAGAVALPTLVAHSPAVADRCRRLAVPLLPPHVRLYALVAAFFSLPETTLRLPERDECFELALCVVVITSALAMTRRSVKATSGWLAAALILTGALGALLAQRYTGAVDMGAQLNFFGAYRFPIVGMYRQAEEVLAAALDEPAHTRPSTKLELGLVLQARGACAQARAVLEQALRDERHRLREAPESSAGWRRRASILRALGSDARARRAFARARALARRQSAAAADATARATARLSAAMTLAAEGRHVAAEAAIGDALAASDLRPIERHQLQNWHRWEVARRHGSAIHARGRGCR